MNVTAREAAKEDVRDWYEGNGKLVLGAFLLIIAVGVMLSFFGVFG